jgi:hypothetical protein
MNLKFFFFITHLTDWICLNPHEWNWISQLSVFCFLRPNKKTQWSGEYPTEHCSNTSKYWFLYSYNFWNPWSWVQTPKVEVSGLQTDSRGEVFGFDEWWIFCACFLCGIKSYELRSLAAKRRNGCRQNGILNSIVANLSTFAHLLSTTWHNSSWHMLSLWHTPLLVFQNFHMVSVPTWHHPKMAAEFSRTWLNT